MKYDAETKYAESPDMFFGRGCDARLAGHPVSSCPYEPSSYPYLQWVAGWRHVTLYWGNLVFGRWAYRPLPVIRDACGGPTETACGGPTATSTPPPPIITNEEQAA